MIGLADKPLPTPGENVGNVLFIVCFVMVMVAIAIWWLRRG
jgi:hypothetical protein